MRRMRGNNFYGWRVVGATFVLAVFGLEMGFHGPAIDLHAVHERTGWPPALISTAVTTRLLVGAVVVANLPALTRRFGMPVVTKIKRAPSFWQPARLAGLSLRRPGSSSPLPC